MISTKNHTWWLPFTSFFSQNAWFYKHTHRPTHKHNWWFVRSNSAHFPDQKSNLFLTTTTTTAMLSSSSSSPKSFFSARLVSIVFQIFCGAVRSRVNFIAHIINLFLPYYALLHGFRSFVALPHNIIKICAPQGLLLSLDSPLFLFDDSKKQKEEISLSDGFFVL